MANGGVVCAQVVLTILTVFEFLFGLALLAIGVVVKLNEIKGITDGLPISQSGAAIALLVIGSFLVVVSFFGCVGAWSKNFCLLVTFCVFTALIFVVVIIFMGLVFAGGSKVDELIDTVIKHQIMTNDPAIFESQKLFQCCGSARAEDWRANSNYTNFPPKSCCDHEIQCLYQQAHPNGCKDFIGGYLTKPLQIIGAIAASCAIALFLAIFAAAYVAHTVRDL